MQYLLFLLISLCSMPTFAAETAASSTHPLQTAPELDRLFKVFVKLKEKQYASLKEMQFRKHQFKKNLSRFIRIEKDMLKRVYIKPDGEGVRRIIIRPQRGVAKEFFEEDEQSLGSGEEDLSEMSRMVEGEEGLLEKEVSKDEEEGLEEDESENGSVKFELNEFSDITDEEFRNQFLLDQSFFDEKKHPVMIEKDVAKLGFGEHNVREYLERMAKKGKKFSDKIVNFYKKKHQPFFGPLRGGKAASRSENEADMFDRMTPHFNSAPNAESVWTLSGTDDAIVPPSKEPLHKSLFSAKSRYRFRRISLPAGTRSISIDGVMVPTVIDGRRLHAVTPIKNQIKCNSCYAFAGIGAIESHYKIKTLEDVQLSEQEIVDCSTRNKACIGGLPHLVYEDIKYGGISYTKDYPYDGRRGNRCRRKSHTPKFPGSHVSSYTNFPKGILQIIKALSKGPVAVISYASFPFKQYRGGIYRGQGCFRRNRPNHSSVLVAYNLVSNKHFVFKNGWGRRWGIRGFYKVQIRSLDSWDHGHCMIGATRYNSVPIIR